MKFNSKIYQETSQRLRHSANQGYIDMRELLDSLQHAVLEGKYLRNYSPEYLFAMGIEYQKTIQLREIGDENNE